MEAKIWQSRLTYWQRRSLAFSSRSLAIVLASARSSNSAQLQQTSAEIDNMNVRYQYRVALATLKYEEGTNPQWAIFLHSLAEK
jgi:hypothetical protein